MKKFSKKYSVDSENNIYAFWDELVLSKKYKNVVSMFPISLAGNLHLGNIFSLFLQDTFVRYLNMKGTESVMIPFFHHSAFLVQIMLEDKILNSKGKKVLLKKNDFGLIMRKHLLEQKDKTEQFMKKLGIVCDWSKEQFTLSESYMRFLKKIFFELYQKGVVFKEKEITYWNNKYQTVVGDTDIKRKKEIRKKYVIRYFIDTKKDSVLLTTFRPDTIFADVAVAVNPLDKRYKKFVGKKVIIPIINKAIPIILDEEVDMTVDNGIIRITPCHDAFGLKLAKKHNLDIDKYAIDNHGNFTELSDTFVGKPVDEFFDNIVQYLDDISNLDEVLEEETAIPLCRKTGVVLEALAMEQRFLRIPDSAKDKFQELLDFNEFTTSLDKDIILNQLDGGVWCISRQYSIGQRFPVIIDNDGNSLVISEGDLIKLFDEKSKKGEYLLMSLIIFHLVLDGRLEQSFSLEEIIEVLFSKSLIDNKKLTLDVYLDIFELENIKSISKKEIKDLRNIVNDFILKPINYTKNLDKFINILTNTFLVGQNGNSYIFNLGSFVSNENKGIVKQEEISFGSVFASILSYIAVESDLLDGQKIYPSLFVGKKDISLSIKSVLLNLTYLHDIGWNEINYHGVCKDKFGDNFSFINNDLDFFSLVNRYGSDTLRLALFDTYHGQSEFIFSIDLFEKYYLIINKLWNAFRYSYISVLDLDCDNSEKFDFAKITKDIEEGFEDLQVFDLWILYVLQEYFDEAEDYFDRKEIGLFCGKLISLINQEFGERYIEIIKLYKSPLTDKVIIWIMGSILKLLYPYLPFVTEKLWKQIGFKGNLFDQKWGNFVKLPGKNYKIHLFMNIIRTFLSLKDKLNCKKHETVDLLIQATPDFLENIQKYENIIKILVKGENISYIKKYEEVNTDYLIDNVIDINVGVKTIAQQSKKEYLHDLQKKFKEKKEYSQYLRGLISTAKINEQEDMIQKNESKLVIVKEEIEELEKEISQFKINK